MTEAGSSSTIPTPVPRPIVAPEGDDSPRVKVLLPSGLLLPATGTFTVWLVTPGAKLSGGT